MSTKFIRAIRDIRGSILFLPFDKNVYSNWSDMFSKLTIGFTALVLLFAMRYSRADEVILSNGDKLTGKVGNIYGGKMKFISPALGEITIDMSQIKDFHTDDPAKVQIKNNGTVQGKITSGDASKVVLEGKGDVLLDTVKQINAPDQKWTGSVLVTGNLARGNTEEANLGVEARALLRREDAFHDDRFTIAGTYTFGSSGTGDNTVVSAENWSALVKYDDYFAKKLYGYVITTAMGDHLADITYRIAPGVGLGYSWLDEPKVHFNTEAGVSYVFQNYDPGPVSDYASLRLAYHLDYKVLENLTLFNNLQWLPAFNDFSDYNLFVDAGLRTNWTKQLFSEFKVEWNRDSTPAPDKVPDDLRFILGVGWTF